MVLTSADIRTLTDSEVCATYIEFLGKERPSDQEVSIAHRLLSETPISGTPFGVAAQLTSVSERNREGELYIEEWSTRWNPLIVSFFLATSYSDPEQFDETPWCAAFVNWCFRRVGRNGTNSVSSGSFRCEGVEDDEQIGDIVVLRKRGEDEECSGKGHVGFFKSSTSDRIAVLGGNQSDMIRTSNYSRTSWTQNLKLHSIRNWQSID